MTGNHLKFQKFSLNYHLEHKTMFQITVYKKFNICSYFSNSVKGKDLSSGLSNFRVSVDFQIQFS